MCSIAALTRLRSLFLFLIDVGTTVWPLGCGLSHWHCYCAWNRLTVAASEVSRCSASWDDLPHAPKHRLRGKHAVPLNVPGTHWGNLAREPLDDLEAPHPRKSPASRPRFCLHPTPMPLRRQLVKPAICTKEIPAPPSPLLHRARTAGGPRLALMCILHNMPLTSL